MLVRASLLALFALASPTLAGEIACEGAFAIDSSEARLIELYGADNVVTGIVPGPEGSEMLATRVFPDQPRKEIQFVWWNEQDRSDPSYIELPSKLTAPGGVAIGTTLEELEALNGGSFTFSGFGWDYVEAGPDTWRVTITKLVDASARADGFCCGGGCSGA